MSKMNYKRDQDLNHLISFLDGELSDSDEAHLKTVLQREPAIARELNELKTVRKMLRDIPRASLPRDFTLRPPDVETTTEIERIPSWRAAFKRPRLRRSFMLVPAILTLVAFGYVTYWFVTAMPIKSTSIEMEPDPNLEQPTDFHIELPPGRALAPEIDVTKSNLSADTSCLELYYTGETIVDKITGEIDLLYDLDGGDLCKVCPEQCVPHLAEGGLATPSKMLVDPQTALNPIGTKSSDSQSEQGSTDNTPHPRITSGATEFPSTTPIAESDKQIDRELTGFVPDTLITNLNPEHLKSSGDITITKNGEFQFQHQAAHEETFVVKVTFDNPSIPVLSHWWSYGIAFGANTSEFSVFRLSSNNTWDFFEQRKDMSTAMVMGNLPGLTFAKETSNTLVLLITNGRLMAWVNGSPIGRNEIPKISIIPGQVWLTAAVGTYDDQLMEESDLSIHFRDVRVWNLTNAE